MHNLIDEFLNYIIVEKGLSKNSVEAYSRDLIKFHSFLKGRGKELIKAGREDIVFFITHLREGGLSSRSTARNMVAVRMFYKFLKSEKSLA